MAERRRYPSGGCYQPGRVIDITLEQLYMNSTQPDSLDAIPMPPEPSSGDTSNNAVSTSDADAAPDTGGPPMNAWAKAQAALNKIQPAANASSASYAGATNQQRDIQSTMYRMYPWMAPQYGGSGYGASSGPFQRRPGSSSALPPWMPQAPAAFLPSFYNQQAFGGMGRPPPHGYGGSGGGAGGGGYPPSSAYNTTGHPPGSGESWRALSTNHQPPPQPTKKKKTAEIDLTGEDEDGGGETSSTAAGYAAGGGYPTAGASWSAAAPPQQRPGGAYGHQAMKPPGLLSTFPRLASQPTPYLSQHDAASSYSDNQQNATTAFPTLAGPRGSLAFRIRNTAPTMGQQFGGPTKRTGANCEPLGSGGGADSAGPSSSQMPPSRVPQSPLQAAAAARQTSQTMPEGVAKYIERAYLSCENDSDKNKVEMMLKQKLTPLLHTGTAWKVDWDKEPLPTDSNFELLPKGLWTPAKELKGRSSQQQNAFGGGGAARGAGRSGGAERFRPPKWGTPSHNRRQTRSSRRSSSSGPEVISSDEGGGRVGGGRRPSAVDKTAPLTSAARRRQQQHSNGRRSPVRRDNSTRKRNTSHKRSNSSDSDHSDRSTASPPVFTSLKSKKKQKAVNKKQKKPPQKFTLEGDKRKLEVMKRERAMRFADKKVKRPVYQPKVVASRLRRPLPTDSVYDDDPFYSVMAANSPNSTGDYLDLSAYNIVGTSRELEKSFFRLTAAPDPSEVRPAQVLLEALALVKRKWRENHNYRYACDQLKSMRQDLTIQCIKSELAVEVYETHARICLENGDREEFNQCQNQLKTFYREFPNWENRYEFTAYRLLYYVYLQNTMDITTLLAELPAESKKADECLRFAMDVRLAWLSGSYVRLFKLYRRAPRMSVYVMDWFLDRERRVALRTLLKSYRPFLPVAFLQDQLGFTSESDLADWLSAAPFTLTMTDDGKNVDCRQAVVIPVS